MAKCTYIGFKKDDDPLFSGGIMTGSLGGSMLRINDIPKDTDEETKPSSIRSRSKSLKKKKGSLKNNSESESKK